MLWVSIALPYGGTALATLLVLIENTRCVHGSAASAMRSCQAAELPGRAADERTPYH